METGAVSMQDKIAYNYEINHGRPAKVESTPEHSGAKRAGVVVEGMSAQTPRGVIK